MGIRTSIGRALMKTGIRWSSIGGDAGTSYSRRRIGMLRYHLPGTMLDFESKAGDLWKNSVASLAINWWTLSFPEARFCVKRIAADGTDSVVPDHPMTGLIKRPNPQYGGGSMLTRSVLGLLCDGNGYLIKVRNNAGGVGQLWQVPHFEVEPRWKKAGERNPFGEECEGWIDWYERYLDGNWTPVRKEDVIHFPWPVADPDWEGRKGLSPWKAQLRQIFSDNEISSYYASLLENNIVGQVISNVDPDDQLIPGSDEMEKLKKEIRAKLSKDHRFDPLTFGHSVKIDRVGFNPEEMALDMTTKEVVGRICAGALIDPMVLGLASETNTHYDNREQAERGAWVKGVIPLMAAMAEVLDLQLGPDFRLKPSETAAFDTKQVQALQPDRGQLYKDLTTACGGPFMTVNEARRTADLKDDGEAKSNLIRERSVSSLPDFGDLGADANKNGSKAIAA